MEQWNLVIDVSLCENCNNCVLANKDEFIGNDFPGYSAGHAEHGPGTLQISRQVRGQGHLVDVAYLPTMCNHCDNAPCIKAAGPGVIRKRDDGIVIIDPHKAVGRKDLVAACPYGAIVWNQDKQLPQAWIFDAHLLDKGWKEPRCAQSCPTGAIEAIKVDAAGMGRLVEQRQLEVLQPELGTAPRVYYRNLHRYAKYFVGGSVVAKVSGVLECVEGAQVSLQRADLVLANTVTDLFGDFKFDALAQADGAFTVKVTHPDHGEASIDAPAGQTTVLDDIELHHVAAVA